MKRRRPMRSLPWILAPILGLACVPRRDLDETAALYGKGGHGANGTASPQGGSSGTTPAESTSQPSAGGKLTSSGGRTSGGATSDNPTGADSGGGKAQSTTRTSNLQSGGTVATTGTAIDTSTNALGGSTSARGGASGAGGAAQSSSTTAKSTSASASLLPELIDPPVQGSITFSPGASWEVAGTRLEAFRIETPTATYFVVKSLAAITSLFGQNGAQWLVYSTNYRTHRSIPNLGGCCQADPPEGVELPTMTTELDAASVTSTHLRLVSKPTDGDYYWLVWDFFVTHMTLTVNRARDPFGFTFDGVLGNNFDANDRLRLSSGEDLDVTSPHAPELPGPAEWAYFSNPEPDQTGSLFLIQHTDDDLAESYTVPDGDGARFVFGAGRITATPIRFSLGLIDSVDPSEVSERVQFVIDKTPSQ